MPVMVRMESLPFQINHDVLPLVSQQSHIERVFEDKGTGIYMEYDVVFELLQYTPDSGIAIVDVRKSSDVELTSFAKVSYWTNTRNCATLRFHLLLKTMSLSPTRHR
jgi:hypothetical protein